MQAHMRASSGLAQLHAALPPSACPQPLLLRRLQHHHRRCRDRAARRVHASAAGGDGSELLGSSGSLDLNSINRNNMTGPAAGAQPHVPSGKAGMGYELMGEEGYTRFVEGRKEERQRGVYIK